jgi:hypothetical protein
MLAYWLLASCKAFWKIKMIFCLNFFLFVLVFKYWTWMITRSSKQAIKNLEIQYQAVINLIDYQKISNRLVSSLITITESKPNIQPNYLDEKIVCFVCLNTCYVLLVISIQWKLAIVARNHKTSWDRLPLRKPQKHLSNQKKIIKGPFGKFVTHLYIASSCKWSKISSRDLLGSLSHVFTWQICLHGSSQFLAPLPFG